MWRLRTAVVPVVIGALGAVTPTLGEWLQQIPGPTPRSLSTGHEVASPGWHIYMCSCKKVCSVSQNSLKNIEEIPGIWSLHEESWTGLKKGISVDK